MRGIGFNEVLKNIGDVTFGMKDGAGALRMQRGVDGSFHLAEGRGEDLNEPGYRPTFRKLQQLTEQRRRLYMQDLREASGLLKKAFDGNKYARLMLSDAMNGGFREALSISDFPALFGDIIDRAVLANYVETPYTWNQIAKLETVNDFRTVRRIRIDYGTGLLGGTDSSGNLIAVESGGPYTETKLTDASYTYRLQKYGERMPFFWETMINDDLNALKDTPARFGIGARRTEEYFVTKLFANNTAFFTTANKNVVKSSVLSVAPTTSFTNPPLSITGLQNALLVMASQVDLTGQPISIDAVTLVVPPALEVTARNILNATAIWMNDFGGTNANAGSGATANLASAQRLEALNWMRGRVQLAVNYQLPIIDTTYGATGWYLFAGVGGRPAILFGKLRGHEMPQLFMKSPNSIAIGEGSMGPGSGPGIGTALTNPMEGDFDSDSIHYKIRVVFGGTTIDPLMAVYSNGSNNA